MGGGVPVPVQVKSKIHQEQGIDNPFDGLFYDLEINSHSSPFRPDTTSQNVPHYVYPYFRSHTAPCSNLSQSKVFHKWLEVFIRKKEWNLLFNTERSNNHISRFTYRDAFFA